MSEQSAENDALSMEQIEALVEEVIEADTVWPDPLPSQVSAVMDIVREAMAQAWDEGNKTVPDYYNPYVTSPAEGCTCGRDTYDGPGRQWLSHAPNCRVIPTEKTEGDET